MKGLKVLPSRNKCIAFISCALVVTLWAVSSKSRHDVVSPRRNLEATSLVRDENAPGIVLMLGFPLSGQAFLQRAIHDMTETSTATNYGSAMMRHEDGIIMLSTRDSIPVYTNHLNGPYVFSDTLPLPTKGYILTRSFGAGFCKKCQAEDYIKTNEIFFAETHCGDRLISSEIESVRYPANLVNRYIHLIRNPMTQIPARFVHERNKYEIEGKLDLLEKFPNNMDGLKRHCEEFDNDWFEGSNFAIEKRMVFKDIEMQELAAKIPCRSDFFRYVQWHNSAFENNRNKYRHKRTRVTYYERIINHQDDVLRNLLDYLQLTPIKEPGIRSVWYEIADNPPYFSREDFENIKLFIHKLASQETWQRIQKYFL